MLLAALATIAGGSAYAQAPNGAGLSEQIEKLSETIAHTQERLAQSERELEEERRELAALRQLAAQATPAPPAAAPDAHAAVSAELDEIREQQAAQQSELATHEQAKVESESKYPVRITGLLLLNTFANTRAVDVPATPAIAVPGSGSAGGSLRQTVLGFDARGPHLFGAKSSAGLRVDFNGIAQPAAAATGYTGAYGGNATFLRLRTAHAALDWRRTEAYFSLDRPILSPDTPSSLTAIAEPALAWSGNLWTWNPQLGVTHDKTLTGAHDLQLQAAFIDAGDAPVSAAFISPQTATGLPPAAAEQSRRPGVEARVAVVEPQARVDVNHFGIGGYFAPHRVAYGYNYNAWAATLDTGFRLPARLSATGSFYRGQALGGLGGGAYKDFAYTVSPATGIAYFQPLDDAGGWAQLKEKWSGRLEFNAALGLDEIFAGQLRPFVTPGATLLEQLARNRTYTGNAIYSPSAYLLFSVEYRHIASAPVLGAAAASNVIGVAAGYKF